MIEFERYGNLLPYEIVSTNLHTFETCFVNETNMTKSANFDSQLGRYYFVMEFHLTRKK
jgi:hypothetical protein